MGEQEAQRVSPGLGACHPASTGGAALADAVMAAVRARVGACANAVDTLARALDALEPAAGVAPAAGGAVGHAWAGLLRSAGAGVAGTDVLSPSAAALVAGAAAAAARARSDAALRLAMLAALLASPGARRAVLGLAPADAAGAAAARSLVHRGAALHARYAAVAGLAAAVCGPPPAAVTLAAAMASFGAWLPSEGGTVLGPGGGGGGPVLEVVALVLGGGGGSGLMAVAGNEALAAGVASGLPPGAPLLPELARAFVRTWPPAPGTSHASLGGALASLLAYVPDAPVARHGGGVAAAPSCLLPGRRGLWALTAGFAAALAAAHQPRTLALALRTAAAAGGGGGEGAPGLQREVAGESARQHSVLLALAELAAARAECGGGGGEGVGRGRVGDWRVPEAVRALEAGTPRAGCGGGAPARHMACYLADAAAALQRFGAAREALPFVYAAAAAYRGAAGPAEFGVQDRGLDAWLWATAFDSCIARGEFEQAFALADRLGEERRDDGFRRLALVMCDRAEFKRLCALPVNNVQVRARSRGAGGTGGREA